MKRYTQIPLLIRPLAVMRLPLLLALALCLPSAAAEEQSPAASARTDFSAFEVIAQRNIFNPTRGSRAAAQRQATERSRPPQVESFRLVGTMLYDKGHFAFFHSSNSKFTKVAKASDQIAEYKIAEVATGHVTLLQETNEVVLKVGQELRREDAGPWKVGVPSQSVRSFSRARTSAAPSRSFSSSGTSNRFPRWNNTGAREWRNDDDDNDRDDERDDRDAEDADADSSNESDDESNDGVDDVLKRLLERRQQEMNR